MIEMDRIGWENGTLVSKAKVTINGNIYEVEPEQYEGTTPLSAENMKQMEDNCEGAIQGLQTLLKPVTLYESVSGASGEVTLTDSVSNYDYIEIVYADTLNHFSTERIYDTTQKSELTSIGSSSGLMYIFNKIIKFTSNIISVEDYTFSYFADNASPRVASEDKIKIYKVIGYKEV